MRDLLSFSPRDPLHQLLTRLLRSRLVAAACAPRTVDDYVDLFNPMWALARTRARIIEVRHEPGNAVSLFLQPSRNFEGFLPGQCVNLSAVVGAVRYTRCFSISSAPHEPHLRVTIEVRPGGKLGTWAATHARPGAMVEISPAMGGFGQPILARQTPPPPVLLVAGGTGITPMRSILLDYAARRPVHEITCLHFARKVHLFGDELSALSAPEGRMRYVAIDTTAAPTRGAARPRLNRTLLDTQVPSWRQAQVLLCGPQRLESAMRACMQRDNRLEQLQVERFSPAITPVRPSGKSRTHRVRLCRSEKELQVRSDRPLLEQLEQAGLRPPHGCRRGLCHTCKVVLRSGRVHSERATQVEDERPIHIQLCVSHPRSDLELEL